jgi:hypothetical protein
LIKEVTNQQLKVATKSIGNLDRLTLPANEHFSILADHAHHQQHQDAKITGLNCED